MTGSIPPEIESAAKLPLIDAALLLWLRRRELQLWDGRSSSPPLGGDAASQIRQATRALDFERANAANGPTFHRLRLAHPHTDERDLKDAIDRGVRLEADCAKHFRNSGAGLDVDAKRAVDLARYDNPGFLDASYEVAAEYLRIVMR